MNIKKQHEIIFTNFYSLTYNNNTTHKNLKKIHITAYSVHQIL